MTDDAKAELINDAAGRAIRYLGEAGDRHVFPEPDALDALAGFESELPIDGADPAAVLDRLDTLGSPATIRSTDGRYLGFVTGGSEPVATAASILATTWDQNAALPVMSPVATRIDAVAAAWVCRLLGLPDTATAGFCSGATVANLTCLLAARDALLARAGWDVGADGLTGAPPIRLVTSAEVHVSVLKGLRAIGIGRNAITFVPTDDRGALDLGSLPALPDRCLVVAQAGNVNTGHSDPFGPLADAVAEVDGWLHVDGAFGLWAAASPRHRHLVEGVERADSWGTDAHKWLNVPYDSGVAICARADDLHRALAIDAPYLPDDGSRAPMQLGLQMSQRARAIETWAVIAARGRDGIAELVAGSCDRAARLADLVVDGGGELLAPVVINQALVAFGDDASTDAVIAAVQADGTCWVGGTTWHGRRAMRISVSDAATDDDDVEMMASAIVAAAARVLTG